MPLRASGQGTSVRSTDRTEGCPWIIAINRDLRLAMTSHDEIWPITEFIDSWGYEVDDGVDAAFAIVKQSEMKWWCVILSEFVQKVN